MSRSWPLAAFLLLLRAMKTMTSFALVVSLSVGCTGVSGAGDDDVGGDDDTTTITPPAPSEPLDTAGTYALTSPIDLTVAAVLPSPAYEYLTTLEDFRTDPAGTFFDLLEDIGGPAVTVIRDALPSALEDRLQGWINDYVADALFGTGPVADELDALFDLAGTVLARADLVSELAVPATDTDGHAVAVHRVRAVRFHAAGADLDVAIPSADVPLLQTSVAVQLTCDAGSSDVELVLADHAFALPYGEYAWAALDLAARTRYGVGLREALGQVIDCPALAASVADHCFLGVCVGHAAELQALCEDGLDAVVARVHAEFAALRFDAVRFHSGLATMADAPAAGGVRDGRADRIDGGVWEATIDIGLGPRDVPATFTGTRVVE